MSRDWLAVYAVTLGKPKYRRLTIPGRAGLLHLWMLAGAETPEATWPNMTTLSDLFDLDGYPPEILPELVERGWIDVDEDGRVWVHDWDDHQLAATRAARRAYEAARKNDYRWRRRHPKDEAKDEPDPEPPLSALSPRTEPDKTGTQQVQDNTGVPKRPGRVRDKTQPRIAGVDLKAAVDAFQTDQTCPGCGDLVYVSDENITADRKGRLWHQKCPETAVAS